MVDDQVRRQRLHRARETGRVAVQRVVGALLHVLELLPRHHPVAVREQAGVGQQLADGWGGAPQRVGVAGPQLGDEVHDLDSRELLTDLVERGCQPGHELGAFLDRCGVDGLDIQALAGDPDDQQLAGRPGHPSGGSGHVPVALDELDAQLATVGQEHAGGVDEVQERIEVGREGGSAVLDVLLAQLGRQHQPVEQGVPVGQGPSASSTGDQSGS